MLSRASTTSTTSTTIQKTAVSRRQKQESSIVPFDESLEILSNFSEYEPSRASCKICKKRYANTSKLNRHIREQHMDNKQAFACGTCGKEFFRKEHLKRHIVYKHEMEYKKSCGLCEYTYVEFSQFAKHLLKKHHLVSCKSCKAYFPPQESHVCRTEESPRLNLKRNGRPTACANSKVLRKQVGKVPDAPEEEEDLRLLEHLCSSSTEAEQERDEIDQEYFIMTNPNVERKDSGNLSCLLPLKKLFLFEPAEECSLQLFSTLDQAMEDSYSPDLEDKSKRFEEDFLFAPTYDS